MFDEANRKRAMRPEVVAYLNTHALLAPFRRRIEGIQERAALVQLRYARGISGPEQMDALRQETMAARHEFRIAARNCRSETQVRDLERVFAALLDALRTDIDPPSHFIDPLGLRP